MSKKKFKTGISYGLTVYNIMKHLGIPFVNTPEGREIRNIIYGRINKTSQSLLDDGFMHGGYKVKRGMPKVYFIAKEPIEMAYLNNQVHDKSNRLNHKKALHRLIMQTSSLKIKGKKRILLQDQIAKR